MFNEIKKRLSIIKLWPWKFDDRYRIIRQKDWPYTEVLKSRSAVDGSAIVADDETLNFVANAPTDIQTLLQFADEAMPLIKEYIATLDEMGEPSDYLEEFLKRWEGK